MIDKNVKVVLRAVFDRFEPVRKMSKSAFFAPSVMDACIHSECKYSALSLFISRPIARSFCEGRGKCAAVSTGGGFCEALLSFVANACLSCNKSIT